MLPLFHILCDILRSSPVDITLGFVSFVSSRTRLNVVPLSHPSGWWTNRASPGANALLPCLPPSAGPRSPLESLRPLPPRLREESVQLSCSCSCFSMTSWTTRSGCCSCCCWSGAAVVGAAAAGGVFHSEVIMELNRVFYTIKVQSNPLNGSVLGPIKYVY